MTGQLVVKLTPSAVSPARDGGIKSGIASLDGAVARSTGKSLRPVVAQAAGESRDVDRWFTLQLEGSAEVLMVEGVEDVEGLRNGPSFRALINAYEQLSADPNVEAVSLVHLLRPTVIPGDAYLADGSLWGIQRINPGSAWDVTTGTGAVTAVIDSGVDYTHPDLAERIWVNPGESGLDALNQDKRTNGVDDDQNSFVDDWRGWLFDSSFLSITAERNDPADDNGHGTHVSGTIAATGNNDPGTDDGRRLVGVAQGGAGLDPQSWTTLVSGAANKSHQSLGTVNLASVGVGQLNRWVTLRLTVTSGGTTAEDRVLISYDPDILAGWPVEIGPFAFWTDTRPPAFADLDGNGTIEVIATAVFDTQLHVWNLNGTYFPGWPKRASNHIFDWPSAPAVIDLDNDGNQEIMVMNAESGQTHAFDHTGVELPGFPISYEQVGTSQCITPYFQSPSALDVDDDGDKELIIRCTSTLFALDVATRAVLWSARVDAGSLDPPAGTQWQAGTPAIGDVNNDGEPEIATTGLQAAYLFSKTGQLLPGWPKTVGNDPDSGGYLWAASPPALGDLNADGLLEVVVTGTHSEDGRLHAFQYDGSELSGWPITIRSQYSRRGGGPIIADLDADGYSEVIALNRAVDVFDHQGQPVAGWEGMAITAGPSQSSPPSVADVDDDGKLEILVADPSSQAGIRIYKRGKGVIWQRDYGYSVGTPAAGDFNRNGILDIAGAQFSITAATQQFFIWKHPGTDTVKGRLYWPQFRFDTELTGAFRLPGRWGTGVDTDLDGFSDERETFIGTQRLDNCGGPVAGDKPTEPSLAWPADLHTTTTAIGPGLAKINLFDVTSFIAPVYRIGADPEDVEYDVRWDLTGDGTIASPGDTTVVAEVANHKCSG
jgi:hypothetical protein